MNKPLKKLFDNLTQPQLVLLASLIMREAYTEKDFLKWSILWISGNDRTADTAARYNLGPLGNPRDYDSWIQPKQRNVKYEKLSRECAESAIMKALEMAQEIDIIGAYRLVKWWKVPLDSQNVDEVIYKRRAQFVVENYEKQAMLHDNASLVELYEAYGKV